MVAKVKNSFETTRQVKNKEKPKNCTLRGQRNLRYDERDLSNKKKSNNLYMFKLC